jgi:hypothetical protein
MDVLDQAESIFERTGLFQTINGTALVTNAAGELVSYDDLRFMERFNNYVMWLMSPDLHTELGAQLRLTSASVSRSAADTLGGLGPILQRASDAIAAEFNSLAVNGTDLVEVSSNLARPLARAGHELYDWATLPSCRTELTAWAQEMLLQVPEYAQYATISITLQADSVTRRGQCVYEISDGADSYELTIDNRVSSRSRRDVVPADKAYVPLETLLDFVRPTQPPVETRWLPRNAVSIEMARSMAMPCPLGRIHLHGS